MQQKTLGLLIILLTLLGAVAIFTGLFRDDKIFYAIGAVCMGFASIFWLLTSRLNIRTRQ